MKTSKEILENLLDALIAAEPIMQDLVRLPIMQVRQKLREIEALAEELIEPS